MGQIESDDVFAFGVKAKELTIQGHQFCFSFSNRKKNVDLFTMGSSIFGIQNKIPCYLLWPTVGLFILPHPTLLKILYFISNFICPLDGMHKKIDFFSIP